MRVIASGVFLAAVAAQAQLVPPRMASSPDIHGDAVVFVAEGDLWLGDRTTGRAERLTSSPGVEASPRFSPDGTRITFLSELDGRREAYVIPRGGGQPQRMTYDPGRIFSVDWAPDGQALWIISNRHEALGAPRLWSVPLNRNQPTRVSLNQAGYAAPGPQGTILFTRGIPNGNVWLRYQGGQANDVWRFDPAKNTAGRLAETMFSEEFPVEVGGTVYCLSETEGRSNLYRVSGGKLQRVTQHTSPARHLATDGKQVVYTVGGDLYTWKPGDRSPQVLKLTLTTDRIHSQPYQLRVRPDESALSPNGKRVLVTARGQLFSVPAKNGDIRAFIQDSKQRVKLPGWSPNGRLISWVSDASDEWNLWVQPADQSAPAVQLTKLSGVEITSYLWAPDSTWLALLDSSGTLWRVPFGEGAPTKISNEGVSGVSGYAISPLSNMLAYVYQPSFNSGAISLRDFTSGKTHVVAGRPYQSFAPTFDRAGRWLYFLSNRRVALSWDNFDFQMNASDSTQIMAVPLAANTPNPLVKEVDDEGKPEEAVQPQIVYDLDQAARQVIALPIPAGAYSQLAGGSSRVFWLDGSTLKQFTLASGKPSDIATGVSGFELSASGRQMLIQQGDQWHVVDTGEGPGSEAVPLGNLVAKINPVEEWRQILRESWRHIRDNFYDPKLHGADWPGTWSTVEAKLPRVGHRQELTDLIQEIQAEVNVSHMFSGGGTNRFPGPTTAGAMGFLRADLSWPNASGPARIDRILESDGFELDERSPLSGPGIDPKTRWIASINGTPLRPTTNLDRLLAGLGGQYVKLSVGNSESGPWRDLWVQLPTSEGQARYYDWVARNRSVVESASSEKVAYIHVPDMGEFGMQEFTKHFYANLDRGALILDVRSNGGGITSGMILERLRRVIFEYDQARYGAPVPYHRMGFLPHVVVICDEGTASDGEYFCKGFRAMGLGTTVGTRTWGGFVAVGGFSAVDGGFVSCPVQGSFTPEGEWLPDGFGFKPDIVVETSAVEDGKPEPQLKRAIEVAMQRLAKEPRGLKGRMQPPTKPLDR